MEEAFADVRQVFLPGLEVLLREDELRELFAFDCRDAVELFFGEALVRVLLAFDGTVLAQACFEGDHALVGHFDSALVDQVVELAGLAVGLELHDLLLGVGAGLRRALVKVELLESGVDSA